MPTIRLAQPSDLPAVVSIVNRAYEVERFIFDKNRTHLAEIEEMSRKGQFLLLESETGELLGSVYVERRDEHAPTWECSPSRPTTSARAAVETHAKQLGCTDLDLRVVSPRTELPGYYRRFGFTETRTEPPHVDVPGKIPWHLIYMSKRL